MNKNVISGILMVLTVAFLLAPGASATPGQTSACENCHKFGSTTTLKITNIGIASTTVRTGETFNVDVSWSGGSSGSTTVKWPNVADNSLFIFNPIQRDYTVTSATSSFAVTAPSTTGTYTIRVYATTGPSPMETDYRDISINVQAPVQTSGFNVIFMVNDTAGNPIQGAFAVMNGIKVKTDASGKAVLNVPQGTYKYAVSMRGYKRYINTANVNADITIPVTLVHR